MKNIIRSIIVSILAILLLSLVVPSVTFNDYTALALTGVTLTVVQLFIQPILKLLFLPVNIISLGLFSWVINVFVIWLVDTIVPGFDIKPMIFLGVQLGEIGTLIFITFLLSLSQSFIGIFIR